MPYMVNHSSSIQSRSPLCLRTNMPAAIIAKDARPDASAQDEKPSCALQLKLQACRPTTYVDVVTRSRYPEAAVVSIPRDDSRSGSRPAKDHGDRHHASETVGKDGQNKAKECGRSGRVRKHVHFAEDEGYASATGTPAPSPKQSHEVAVAVAVAKTVCGDHDDRGRVLVKSGSARVPKPVHKEEQQPQSTTTTTTSTARTIQPQPQPQPLRTVTSRKATSQPRTSKAKKRPRTDKTDSATPPTESTGGSYRNQYGNIVFEDFF
ncbi:hypothetical protein BC567DRAFT_27343 [Phyllosticta citribraziliensis]